MKRSYIRTLSRAAALAAILALPAPAGAAQTDISQAPLGTAPTASVLPNLMFILDDSGSMARDHMPDQVNDANITKSCSSSACDVAGATNAAGHPPYFASPFNAIYYNPQITYKPGVDSLGASLGNANPIAAKSDPYTGSSATNLTNKWREMYFCTKTNPSTAELTNTTICRRNGIDTPNPFIYQALGASGADDMTQGLPTTKYRNAVAKDTGNPYYYVITPREHCEDERLQTCVLSATPVAGFAVPAPVRWCNSAANAAPAGVVSDLTGSTTPKCQSKVSTTYKFPRQGNITRTDIVPATATYGGRPKRSDCAAAPTCTYAEELQNFANWYSYYSTRMQLMKTASGNAFSVLDDRNRVGFLTINAGNSTEYLKIDKFTPTHKKDWYDKFYAQKPTGGTPLRQALSRVGRHYAGVTTGINSFMPEDPVQYSCQQNFALLTTDGYWNGLQGLQIDNSAVGDQDNVDSGFSSRASGAFDGNLGGTSGSSAGSANTLADVAMYFYKTDLRASGPVSKNNVPTTAKNKASHQHMVTFTLGLGLDGLMTYRPDYETATTGDFARIRNGDPAGCSWTTGPCDWPKAQQDSPSSLDDLWHAAVNGRGTYFSAKDPDSLQAGLTNALTSIQSVVGAAASSATSTPNITPTDNFIYSSTYRTLKWDGEVVAEKINTSDGTIIPGIVWSASTELNARVAASSDTRTIYTFDPASPTKLKPFFYADMTPQEKAWFDNKCAALVQCPPMLAAQQAQVNQGDNLVNWLRGRTEHSGSLYRTRDNVLGDTVNAKPTFVGKPNLQFGDAVVPNYSSFKAGPAGSRQNALYVAANDGMLHALNATTGVEMWAYVPRLVMPDMHKLATTNYDINHRYYVDGSPATMDVFFASSNQWKTVLVGGLKAGGRGYYALDITDPANPKALWDVCADPIGWLTCTAKDNDIGYSFGQPVITKRASDGKWVVLFGSGYNNVTPGDGKGYLFVVDVETGAILQKVTTGVGDTTTPSGFAHISGFATNFAVDNTATLVYGGDLLGNMWRFDMTTAIPTRQRIAQFFDGSTPPKPQSVTTRPEVTRFDAGYNVMYVGTGRLLGGTDLQDPATLVPPQNRAYQQTVYAFKDTGADLGNLGLPGAKLVKQTLSVIDSTTRTVSKNAVDWSTQNGWFVDFNPSNDSPGERVNIDMQLVKGALLVATNEPNSDACSAGGNSFLYQFDYRAGSYIESAPGDVAGVKLGSALVVGFIVYRLPSGQLKYGSTLSNNQRGQSGINPGSGSAIGKRVSWRELIL